jgi:hypothetical protein
MNYFGKVFFERRYKSGSVNLRAVTWVKDSYDLFDYESKQTIEKNVKTCSNNVIVRNSTGVLVFNPEEDNLIKLAPALATLH